MRSRTLWKAKYLMMNAISKVPFHEKIHFAGQRLFGRHRLDAEEMFGRALELFLLLRRAGGEVKGRTVLEIGTGWFPFAAALSSLYGAKEVLTFDIHPWLTLKNAVLTFEHAARLGEKTLEKVGGERGEFERRRREALRLGASARRLEDFLLPLGIRYMPKTDLLETGLPEGSVDVVFSSNVLEHIPPDVLERMHAKTAKLAREGAYAVHRFNPDDHYKTLSGSTVSFLEYDEARWRRLGGYGLAYHNRMRTVEHSEAVARSPWTLAFWAEALDGKAERAIESGRIVPAGRFANMSPEALSAWYAWFVLQKNGAPHAARAERVKWIDELIA